MNMDTYYHREDDTTLQIQKEENEYRVFFHSGSIETGNYNSAHNYCVPRPIRIDYWLYEQFGIDITKWELVD